MSESTIKSDFLHNAHSKMMIENTHDKIFKSL